MWLREQQKLPKGVRSCYVIWLRGRRCPGRARTGSANPPTDRQRPL